VQSTGPAIPNTDQFNVAKQNMRSLPMNLRAIDRDGTVSGITGALPDVGRSAIDSTVQLYAKVGWIRPWTGYLAFEDGTCVGTCAFVSAPKNNIVEIAYFTFPGYEGRGFATRMAASLVALAKDCAPEVSITAHTLAEENASTRILRKVGFVFAGPRVHEEDGQIWVWRHGDTIEQRSPSTDRAVSSGTSPAGQESLHP